MGVTESNPKKGLPPVVGDNSFLDPVNINVGGIMYTTTLGTLTKFPESKVAKLFNGTLAVTLDPNSKHYFLDVDGSVFSHILNYLRYGELVLPKDFGQLHLLKKQAEYFELKAMVNALEELINGEERTKIKQGIVIVEDQLKSTCRINQRRRSKKNHAASIETEVNKKNANTLEDKILKKKEESNYVFAESLAMRDQCGVVMMEFDEDTKVLTVCSHSDDFVLTCTVPFCNLKTEPYTKGTVLKRHYLSTSPHKDCPDWYILDSIIQLMKKGYSLFSHVYSTYEYGHAQKFLFLKNAKESLNNL